MFLKSIIVSHTKIVLSQLEANTLLIQLIIQTLFIYARFVCSLFHPKIQLLDTVDGTDKSIYC